MSLNDLSSQLPNPSSLKEFLQKLRAIPKSALVADGDEFLSKYEPAGWYGTVWLKILVAQAEKGDDVKGWMNKMERWVNGFSGEQIRRVDEGEVASFYPIFETIYEKHLVTHTTLLPVLVTLSLRFPPTPTYLTPFHALAVRVSLETRCYSLIAPILPPHHAATNISLKLTPTITYLHSLTYHFHAGIIAAVLKNWNESLSLLESVITHPTASGIHSFATHGYANRPQPAASLVQIHAFRYLLPVHLIVHGTTLQITSLPKNVGGPTIAALSRDKVVKIVTDCCEKMERGVSDWATAKELEILEKERLLGILQIANKEVRVRKVKGVAKLYKTILMTELIGTLADGSEKEIQEMIETQDLSAKLIVEDDGKTWVEFLNEEEKFVDQEVTLKEILERKIAAQIDLEQRLYALDREKVTQEAFVQKLLKSLNSRTGPSDAFDEEGLGGWHRGGDDTDWT